MGQPDQLGVEGAHHELALGLGIVEFAMPDRDVSADHDRSGAGFDDDNLHAVAVTRCRDKPQAGHNFAFAIDGKIGDAGCIDPFADRVVVLGAGIFQLAPLHIDRLAREQVIAAAMVKMQMGVDDDIDARQVKILSVQRRLGCWSISSTAGCKLVMPVSDQNAAVRVVDDMDIDRHATVPGE